MITATAVELRAGARLLLVRGDVPGGGRRPGRPGRPQRRRQDDADPGPGRGGPAGDGLGDAGRAASATCRRTRARGDLEQLASDRILSARGLDEVVDGLRETEGADGQRRPGHGRAGDAPVRGACRSELAAAGGYAAESEAAQICASLGLPERVLAQPLATLSGGQRRRVELARILFGDAQTLLLDEPTNHLDADSIVWLREFLRTHKGGLVVISHDVGLLRGLRQPGLPPGREPRRARPVQRRLEGVPRAARDRRAAAPARAEQRREAGGRAARPGGPDALQGDQGAGPRRTWTGGPSGCWPGWRAVRRSDRVARLRFPDPAPCGTTPLTASGPVEVVRLARGLHRRRPRRRPRLAGRRARAERRRQDDAAAHPRRARAAGHRHGASPGTACGSGYYAQEHETLDTGRTVLQNMRLGGAGPRRGGAAADPRRRSCSPATTSTSRPRSCPAGRRPGWRWRRWSCPARTSCCSTSRRTTSTPPAAPRCCRRCTRYQGAVVLVTHDEGAVEALQPGAGRPAARTASRTCGPRTTPTSSPSPEQPFHTPRSGARSRTTASFATTRCVKRARQEAALGTGGRVRW